MKMLKRTISVIMLIMMFITCVYAENTTNATFKVTINEENVSVEEYPLIGSVDYSDLNVKVIKMIGETKNVIYTGPLSGYDNGAWVNIDFDSIDFALIFNWGSSDEEELYIIPLSKTTEEQSKVLPDTSETTAAVYHKSMVQTVSGDVNVDISLLYDNAYSECVLNAGEDLTAEIKLENTNETTSVDVSVMIALYDEQSKLIGIKMESQNVTANGNAVIPAKITVPVGNTASSAKIMVWNGNNIKPYTNAVTLSVAGLDFFGDDYSLAQIMGERNSAFGMINSQNDTDIFEFKVFNDGLYTFESYGNTDTYATLSNKLTPTTVIKSDDDSGIDGNFRISETLQAGQTYYLKVSGKNTGKYKLVSNYAIGNVFGTVSPVKSTGDHEFDKLIESKCELYTFDSNEFVAQMRLHEYTSESSDYASFSLVGVSAGEYLVKTSRPGYLSRYSKIILNDNAVDLGSKALIAGDVNNDGIIDARDLTLLRNALNSEYGSGSYNINADLNGDKIVDSVDESILNENMGLTSNDYDENVSYISLDVSVSNYTAAITGKATPDSEILCSVYLRDIFVSEQELICGADGSFNTTVELSQSGTYTIIATADNRAFDAVKTISCN